MPEASLKTLTSFLERLEEAHIYYKLSKARAETVMVEITVPGERWEVEFFAQGQIDVEVFKVDGLIRGEDALDALFERFSI